MYTSLIFQQEIQPHVEFATTKPCPRNIYSKHYSIPTSIPISPTQKRTEVGQLGCWLFTISPAYVEPVLSLRKQTDRLEASWRKTVNYYSCTEQTLLDKSSKNDKEEFTQQITSADRFFSQRPLFSRDGKSEACESHWDQSGLQSNSVAKIILRSQDNFGSELHLLPTP